MVGRSVSLRILAFTRTRFDNNLIISAVTVPFRIPYMALPAVITCTISSSACGGIFESVSSTKILQSFEHSRSLNLLLLRQALSKFKPLQISDRHFIYQHSHARDFEIKAGFS